MVLQLLEEAGQRVIARLLVAYAAFNTDYCDFQSHVPESFISSPGFSRFGAYIGVDNTNSRLDLIVESDCPKLMLPVET
jgi:hypothetical protein